MVPKCKMQKKIAEVGGSSWKNLLVHEKALTLQTQNENRFKTVAIEWEFYNIHTLVR